VRRILILALSSFVIALSAFAVPSQADTLIEPKTLELVKNAPTTKDYSDAKLVHLFGERTIKLEPDGGYTVEWHDIFKVLTFMGKKELSNIKYQFDSSYENIDITRARSITMNEDSSFSVVVADSLQINDITMPGLSDAGMYSDLKQRVVTIPGLVDSSVVEIKGTIKTFGIPKKPFGGIEFLAKSDPVIDYRLSIDIPLDKDFVYLSANGAPQPKIEGNRYIWSISSWKGLVPEPQGPLGRDLLPCVYYSSTKSWTLAADLIQSQFAPKAMPDLRIINQAKSIVGELTGLAEVESLASWVARNIRHIDVNINDVGFIPSSATKVLDNSYGDSRDRSVLLSALLRARGYNPQFALLPPRDAVVQESVPTLAQFSRVTVCVDIPNTGLVWLWTEDDFTPNNRLPGYDGEKALLVSVGKGQLVELPRVSPEANGMDQDYQVTLDEKGSISGKMSVIFKGDYERDVRDVFRDSKPRHRVQRLQEIVSGLGGGELVSDSSFAFENLEDNYKSPTLSLEFSSKDFAFIQGDMMIFNFPQNPVSFSGSAISTSLDERTEPLVIRTPFKESYSFKLKTPAGYKVVWASEPASFRNSIGVMNVSSELGEGVVDYNVSLTIMKTWITPSEYNEIRDLMRAYMAPKNRMVLLEKIVEPPIEVEGE